MQLNTYDMLGRPEDVDPVSRVISKYTQFKHDPKSPDFLIVVGGDGTLVWRGNRERVYNTRILRVHHRENSPKTLGYTADVNLNNLDVALKDIIDDNYFLQEEKLIDCFINGEEKDTAINDVAIIHKQPFHTLLFDAVVDKGKIKVVLPSPKCDRFLVSTPYGSAAWNFSSGGAIDLDADCMLINITGSTIKHERYISNLRYPLYVRVFCDALVGVDAPSGNIYEAKDGDKIAMVKSDKRISFIRTNNTLESLVSKIYRQIEHSRKSVKKI